MKWCPKKKFNQALVVLQKNNLFEQKDETVTILSKKNILMNSIK